MPASSVSLGEPYTLLTTFEVDVDEDVTELVSEDLDSDLVASSGFSFKSGFSSTSLSALVAYFALLAAPVYNSSFNSASSAGVISGFSNSSLIFLDSEVSAVSPNF